MYAQVRDGPVSVKEERPAGPPLKDVQWCPDFNERHVLLDGKTAAIRFPDAGYNCKQTEYEGHQPAYAQISEDPKLRNAEWVPSFKDRHVLDTN